MFCVECGKEGKLYEGLCSQCYLAKNVFVKIPPHIELEVCAHCGARRRGKKWILGDEKGFIAEVVKENASGHPDVTGFDVHLEQEFEDENNVNLNVITHANVLGLKAEEKHETRLRIKRSVCDECSKQHGGYWEAKIQLRSSKRSLSEEDLEKALDIVEFVIGKRDGKDKGAYVTKVERIHNGLDLYLGSKNIGKALSKQLANEFGGDVKASYQLMGRKDGKDVYRATYVVRWLGHRVGDFIQLGEDVFKVLSLSSNKVLLKALGGWKNISRSLGEIEEAKLLGGGEIVKEMVVVSKSEKEIQVLDPDTLKTIDILLPEGFEASGDTVKVVKCEAGYFLVGQE